jgi:hypothetical protein
VSWSRVGSSGRAFRSQRLPTLHAMQQRQLGKWRRKVRVRGRRNCYRQISALLAPWLHTHAPRLQWRLGLAGSAQKRGVRPLSAPCWVLGGSSAAAAAAKCKIAGGAHAYRRPPGPLPPANKNTRCWTKAHLKREGRSDLAANSTATARPPSSFFGLRASGPDTTWYYSGSGLARGSGGSGLGEWLQKGEGRRREHGAPRRPAPLLPLGIRLNSVMLAFLVMGGNGW